MLIMILYIFNTPVFRRVWYEYVFNILNLTNIVLIYLNVNCFRIKVIKYYGISRYTMFLMLIQFVSGLINELSEFIFSLPNYSPKRTLYFSTDCYLIPWEEPFRRQLPTLSMPTYWLMYHGSQMAATGWTLAGFAHHLAACAHGSTFAGPSGGCSDRCCQGNVMAVQQFTAESHGALGSSTGTGVPSFRWTTTTEKISVRRC